MKRTEEYGRKYRVGYGPFFLKWLQGVNDFQPYNSYGNGAAMRISSIPYFYRDSSKKAID